MKELEDRQRHNLHEQKRFLRDAAEDGVDVMLYISTLDGSPLGAPGGLAWGTVHVPAREVVILEPYWKISVPSIDAEIPLQYVFAMSVAGLPARQSLVVLDTAAQRSSAAAMFNDPEVREMLGKPKDLPLCEVCPEHRNSIPASRRAALRILKGGKP
jgi:hypothetical protein